MLSRRALVVLSAYLILLAVSHLVRILSPGETIVPPGTGSALVEAVKGDTGSERSVVVLLHGSPGSRNDFDSVIPELEAYRTIAPDLPGFGLSERAVPDYSARAHARSSADRRAWKPAPAT